MHYLVWRPGLTPGITSPRSSDLARAAAWIFRGAGSLGTSTPICASTDPCPRPVFSFLPPFPPPPFLPAR